MPVEVRRAADLLERRRELAVLYAAHLGPSGSGSAAQAIGPISPRKLTERLGSSPIPPRDEADGRAVERRRRPAVPATLESAAVKVARGQD